MAGYRYGGAQFDVQKPLAPPRPRKTRAAQAECGTLGGVSKHRTQGEPPCELCLAATRAYKKEWRARVRANKGLPPRVEKAPKVKRPRKNAAECGTNSGYDAHCRNKTTICPPCRDAHNEYNRDYKARKRAA